MGENTITGRLTFPILELWLVCSEASRNIYANLILDYLHDLRTSRFDLAMSDEEFPTEPHPSNLYMGSTLSRPETYSISATLKRRASPSFEGLQDDISRKRMKEDVDNATRDRRSEGKVVIDGDALADDLAQELQCGCCSELVYRPVQVIPCMHTFCGSCCVLWIRVSDLIFVAALVPHMLEERSNAISTTLLSVLHLILSNTFPCQGRPESP